MVETRHCLVSTILCIFAFMQNNKFHIVIVGAGNVGTQLAKLFDGKVDELTLCRHSDANIPVDADLYLICVSDTALEEVVAMLPRFNGVVAHTSGTMSKELLSKFPKHGVFYPFQSFRREIELQNPIFPILIEASDTESERLLRLSAELITDYVVLTDEAGRRQLHVAGVFASNFTNLMYDAAFEVVGSRFNPEQILMPLLRETLDRLKMGLPENFQTGPAIRNDRAVIESHLEWLRSKPELQKIYKDLSQILLKKYGHEELP